MIGAPPTGVLLAQSGAPDAHRPDAVRAYLRQAQADPRVVDLRPPRWRRGAALRKDVARLAEAYRLTWQPGGAAVRVTSQVLAARVGEVLGAPYHVELGLAQGAPSLTAALDALAAAGCVRLVVVPLFPQYSSVSTAAVTDAVSTWARKQRNVPALGFVRDFGTMPRYIAALAASVVAAEVEATPEAPLVMSYAGIPQRYADTGDPYGVRCHATSAALAKALGLAEGAWKTTFQSHGADEPWLRPYTDVALQELARGGKRTVALIAPSFLVDGVETLDGLEREARGKFFEAGGERLVRVPALGDSDTAVEAIVEVVLAGQAGAPCTVGLACGCTGPCTYVRD